MSFRSCEFESHFGHNLKVDNQFLIVDFFCFIILRKEVKEIKDIRPILNNLNRKRELQVYQIMD